MTEPDQSSDSLMMASQSFFKSYKAERNPCENTVRNFESIISRFLKKCTELGKTNLDEISREDIVAYLNGLDGTRTSTKKTHQRFIGIFLNGAHRYGLCQNHFAGTYYKGVADIPRAPQKDVTEAEIKQMVDASNSFSDIEWLIFYFLIGIPLRISELVNLKVQDINWRDRNFTIYKSKNRKTRIVPLPHYPKEFYAKLKGYINDKQPGDHVFGVGIRGIHNKVQSIFTKSKVDANGRGSHAFRHTIIMDMLHKCNIPVGVVAESAGNTPKAIYNSYVNRIEMSEIKKATQSLNRLRISQLRRDGNENAGTKTPEAKSLEANL